MDIVVVWWNISNIMKNYLLLFASLTFLFLSCNKDNDGIVISECDKGSTVTVNTFKEHMLLVMDKSNNSILDTCFYWDLVNATVLKIEINNPNGNKPLGTVNFKNPFSVSVIFGDSNLVSGQYEIEKTFLDPNNIVSDGKVSMFADGNEAIGGKISYGICNGQRVVEFSNIDFGTTSNNVIDTIFTLSGKIICKK